MKTANESIQSGGELSNVSFLKQNIKHFFFLPRKPLNVFYKKDTVIPSRHLVLVDEAT